MTMRRKPSTLKTRSDYEQQLEEQNEQLVKKLAESQRINEYHESNKYDCIHCGVTYIHNAGTDIQEYYTSNEFWHPINKLHEHGGLASFVDLIVDPNMTYGLTVNSAHVSYTRNDRVIWDMFFDYISTEDKWRISGLQLRQTIYSGKDLKNTKKYTWGRIIKFFKEREHHYKQTY